MSAVYPALISSFGIAGIGAVLTACLRPKLIGSLFIVLVVLGTGIMLNGYALVDEYLVACIILGVFIFLSVRPWNQSLATQNPTMLSKIHFWVFFLFMLYMVFQSFRGLIFLEDPRMIRFIVFFLMLAVFTYLASSGFISFPVPAQTINLVLVSTTAYFILYLLHGISSELLNGINRFDVQGYEWSGSTVAMFPVFTLIPAIYSGMNRKNQDLIPFPIVKINPRILSWLSLLVAVGASFYYDSRISLLAIIGFLVISSRELGILRTLVIAIVFIVSFFAIYLIAFPGQNFFFEIENLFTTLFISGAGMQASDADRKLAVLAALRMIGGGAWSLLFGTGFYTERFTMIPHYVETLLDHGLRVGSIEIVRVSTFPSFLGGTGVIGIVFLIASFFFTACEIFVNTKHSNLKFRKVLLFTLLLVFVSTFIGTNLDLILFYFCIMPSGLLVQMSKYKEVT